MLLSIDIFLSICVRNRCRRQLGIPRRRPVVATSEKSNSGKSPIGLVRQEVAFSEWTPDRRVRHAVFRGVRTDKPAALIVRERAKAVGSGGPAKKAPKTPGLKVTNPERVIDPPTGLRKVDLVRYYESVAEWIPPHLKGQPTSLVRGPTGVTGELLFQKHDDKLSIPHVRNLAAGLWPGHAELLKVPNAQALVACPQMMSSSSTHGTRWRRTSTNQTESSLTWTLEKEGLGSMCRKPRYSSGRCWNSSGSSAG